MAMMATAVIGSSIIGGAVQSRAARTAAAAQTQAAEMGIAEQRRQFDEATKLLAPYVDAGEAALADLSPYAQAGVPALEQQMALAGVSGPAAQREAISAIEGGAEYQSLVGAGEEAILQSAAATGGLRGGNTQAALAQFRPQVLSSLINQQYSRLGGLTALGQTTSQNIFGAGQAAAARQAAAGQASAANIGNLYGQQGAAAAGSALASGQAFGNVMGSIGQYAGGVSAGILPNPFGGAPITTGAPISTNVVSGSMTSSLIPPARPF
jgi:hypothetical protein